MCLCMGKTFGVDAHKNTLHSLHCSKSLWACAKIQLQKRLNTNTKAAIHHKVLGSCYNNATPAQKHEALGSKLLILSMHFLRTCSHVKINQKNREWKMVLKPSLGASHLWRVFLSWWNSISTWFQVVPVCSLVSEHLLFLFFNHSIWYDCTTSTTPCVEKDIHHTRFPPHQTSITPCVK